MWSFDFNEERLSAFLMLKGALISVPTIQTSDWELLFEVTCDVSDYTLGVILGQRKENKPYAIYYISHTLDEVQVNYATM